MAQEVAGSPTAGKQVGVDAESPGFSVGQRVHAAADPRRTGTVRYVGALEGYHGTWIGVDWDDGGGKHDGVCNGVRYFTAKGVTSGSFVRQRSLSSGVAFLEALFLRYGGKSSKEEEGEMYVFSTSMNRVAIQLVGKDKILEKISRFDELSSVALPHMGVSLVGHPQEINSAVPNVKELDLTGNLFSNWQDVSYIFEALPALTCLNLTSNILEGDLVEFVTPRHLRVLVLNNCGMTWENVETLRLLIPGIKELHLMGNKLKTLMRSHIKGFDELRILNLEDNNFDEWDEIVKLSQLSSLEQLHLNRNKLKHISYPPHHSAGLPNDFDTYNYGTPFQNLRCLLLGCNEIEDLASVDSLNMFPSLLDIRLSENVVADPARGGVPRFVLVARLSKVEILNGSEVTSRERKDSEIRYVRLVMAKMQFNNNLQEIKQLHPRFAELKMRHGIEDENSSSGVAGPQKMSAGLLSVVIKCIAASIGEKPPAVKRLPPSTTIGKLKVLCKSFFNLKAIKPQLFLQEEDSAFPLLLDDDMASLMDLGISPNATILVDEES